MQIMLRLSIVLILSIVLMAALPPAHAQDGCPEEDGSVTVADRIEDAQIVLEGTITDVFTYSESLAGQQVAVVQVSQYFKGSGPATISLAGFGQRANCLQSVQAGQGPLLFFVIDDAGTYRAYYPLLASGAYLMTDELRNDVLEVIDQNAATPDPLLAPNMSAYATAQQIATGVVEPPTQEPVAIAPTREITIVGQDVTDMPPTILPTAAVVTGTQTPVEDDDDESGIDILPVLLGIAVLVIMLGGGLLFASRRSMSEEE